MHIELTALLHAWSAPKLNSINWLGLFFVILAVSTKKRISAQPLHVGSPGGSGVSWAWFGFSGLSPFINSVNALGGVADELKKSSIVSPVHQSMNGSGRLFLLFWV
jgi:hypothetical protein